MQLMADGAKVRRWRDERCWSQEHLAEVAGISLRTVQRMENGENASRESVMALASAFDVDVVALTVDAGAETEQRVRHHRAKGLAALRLSFQVHAACYAFGMLVFAGIGLGLGDAWAMLWPMVWWTTAVAGHGLALGLVLLVKRQRRLGRA